jgi:hypothetical protein
MKTASQIFEVMKKHLHSEKFLQNNRIKPTDFIRNRLLPLPVIFLFIFNLLRKSIAKEQITFCKNCDQDSFTRAAVTKARAKLSPRAFVELNQILLTEFYNDNAVNKFHDLILLAIDGSTTELPIDSLKILQHFGYTTNQTQIKIPMARVSTLHDVVNGITWDGIIAHYESNERALAIQHFETIKSLGIDLQKVLAIFDRGYPSLALIVYLLMNNLNFLMRVNSHFLKEVNDIVKADKRDTIIKISLKRATRAAKADIKELFPDLNLNETISIRIVVVTLSTGENEVLITSLLDKEQYPYKIFRELYFKRWGIEENYKFLKVRLEIENFSGKSPFAIEQDFHATVLAANSRALLSLEAAQELTCGGSRLKLNMRKYAYEINKNVSIEVLKNDLVASLLNPQSNMDQFCKKTKAIIKQHLVPIRPGRSFKRIRKHPNRKYHMNTR